MRTAQEVVALALGVIQERGWRQGVVEDHVGRVCARGAINVALTGNAKKWGAHQERMAVEEVLIRHIPEDFPVRHVVAFNNSPDTTIGDIEQWFEKAAADERVDG